MFDPLRNCQEEQRAFPSAGEGLRPGAGSGRRRGTRPCAGQAVPSKGGTPQGKGGLGRSARKNCLMQTEIAANNVREIWNLLLTKIAKNLRAFPAPSVC